MINYVTGNLLDSDCTVLVNAVNCVGAMGKGLALEFRQRLPPQMFDDYRAACRERRLRPGTLHTWRHPVRDLLVVNFPTKDHWRDPSTYEYVSSGLAALRDLLAGLPGVSVAVPPLGCGNGRLEWGRVRPLIESYLGGLDAHVFVYPPSDAPEAQPPRLFLPVTDPSQVTPDLHGRVVVATGHRMDRLGGYNAHAEGRLLAHVTAWLEALRPLGVITGFALGTDQAVAEACVDLGIPFIAAVPCRGQADRWPEPSRLRYERLLAHARLVEYVTDGPYRAGCMQKRNVWMIDRAASNARRAALVLAMWGGGDGGTKNCVAYARSKALPMLNMWPGFSARP